MADNLKIGLSGLYYNNSNLGCAALAYSFYHILSKALVNVGKEADVTLCMRSMNPIEKLPVGNYDNMNFSIVTGHYKSLKGLKGICKMAKSANVYFEFTGGDSFSDIYGPNIFIKNGLLLTKILLNRKKLVLGPQTYGPFERKWIKNWARFIFNRSVMFTRDEMSYNRIKDMTKSNITVVTDVAFALPYDKNIFDLKSDKIKVGINVSGLLLHKNVYKKGSFLGSGVDYGKYIEKLISTLLESGKYEVHLIPHVIGRPDTLTDNDNSACRAMLKKFPQCILSPMFKTPMEAKSYIANMDIFTGARMHATIAGVSSGVATIPFSYSVKFEGLYNGLGYKRVISGLNSTTDEALSKTLDYIHNYKELENETAELRNRALERLGVFSQKLENILKEM